MPTEFTPISALIGGLLIGLAAAGMMLLNGRIAGISGIVARLLPPAEREGWTDRAAFLLGLVVAPLLWLLATGEGGRQIVSSNVALMALAGLSGWLRLGSRWRLHEWPRRLRLGASVKAIIRRRGDLHGRGDCDGVHHASHHWMVICG